MLSRNRGPRRKLYGGERMYARQQKTTMRAYVQSDTGFGEYEKGKTWEV